MNIKDKFTDAGFQTIEKPSELQFSGLKELQDYIKNKNLDNSDNLDKNTVQTILKTVLNLSVDEKVNGYGLSFIGRNVAKAKYMRQTDKELKINAELSKNFHTTQNIVLKGDNLDCLKILKSYYSGKIKCIYIDPPYNTQNDDFVYPDKFDKEEREILGMTNLNDDELARMEFCFGNKCSHNGWLTFIYPRLALARDLLSNDGVIFISIDDNEQANLKLLCDEIFGEENFVVDIIRKTKSMTGDEGTGINIQHENLLCFAKDKVNLYLKGEEKHFDNYKNPDNDPKGDWISGDPSAKSGGLSTYFPVLNPFTQKEDYPPKGRYWAFSKETCKKYIENGKIKFKEKYKENERGFIFKRYKSELGTNFNPVGSLFAIENEFMNSIGTTEQLALLNDNVFSNPKPINFIQKIISYSTNADDLVLDFFAGSGTTGHAVMQLNAEDGGNRRFILCQIDEPINKQKKKEAFDFCVANNLPPVISSIMIERLRRAGNKNKSSDTGFKVFDCIDAPKIAFEDEQLFIDNNTNDPLSRIYSMIFKIGLDNPSNAPLEIVKDCMYHYEATNNYYIANAVELDKVENKPYLLQAIKSDGRVFIDGWTTTINITLQQYREDIKIVL